MSEPTKDDQLSRALTVEVDGVRVDVPETLSVTYQDVLATCVGAFVDIKTASIK